MISSQLERGFSAVELLITLFIASIFLLAGYQLYSFVFANGAEATMRAKASQVAYNYLHQTKDTLASGNCSASTPVNNQAVTSSGLNQATVTVTVSCPYSSGPIQNMFLIRSTLQYKSPTEMKTVSHAEYKF